MDESREATILLVEDDLADQKLIKNSIVNQGMPHQIYAVASGEEALEYLERSKNGDETAPWPDLILLDLNMPGMGGKEFLKRIKNNDDFDMIPVIILTTSDSDRDVLEGYKLQAAGYVKKPFSMPEFYEVAKMINEYWFILCKQLSERNLYGKQNHKHFVSR